MTDEAGARELYYRNNGRSTSWYALSAQQRQHWRERYQRAKDEADRVLARIRRDGRDPS